MAGSHVELETKLTPPEGEPGWLLPLDALREVPGVHAVSQPPPLTLVARYHDTAGLDLLRARLTLRRREGGPDEGWHLKLPTSGAARREQHEPLGAAGDPVPAALLGLSRARHRDRPLPVVAVLTTQRRTTELTDADGAVLVEVAEDRVTAELVDGLADDPAAGSDPQRWDEVEVELVGGTEDLLHAVVQVLLDAGARPQAHRSKLGRVLATAGVLDRVAPGPRAPTDGAASVLLTAVAGHVETLLTQDPLVRLDAPDAVHSMRVASRRLRSLLAAFRPLLDPAVAEPLREELRWLGQVLGGARDAEVVQARLARHLAALPDASPDRTWPERPGAPTDGAVAALDGDRYLALLAALDRFVARPPVVARRGRRKGTKQAARRAYRRVAAALAAVPGQGGPEQDHALHQVRKATKRLRYTCDAVVGVHGRDARRLARRAEDLQEHLGEHQDSVLAREVLHGAAGRTDEQAETFLLGTLAGLELAATRVAVAGLDRPVRRLHRAAERWFG
ncbi:CHAD domain-containing protein [Aquipuribacter sp. MA13-6]|uniref:CYTH and CHAD domain-containing protein n=1 Tax=unclassified Aquipuribacter TaxID=2635084 RepID=UPI003EEC5943